MSARFFGEWPKDSVGNPLKITITSPYQFKDSHKDALSRAGANPNPKPKLKKPLSALSDETVIGARRKISDPSGK